MKRLGFSKKVKKAVTYLMSAAIVLGSLNLTNLTALANEDNEVEEDVVVVEEVDVEISEVEAAPEVEDVEISEVEDVEVSDAEEVEVSDVEEVEVSEAETVNAVAEVTVMAANEGIMTLGLFDVNPDTQYKEVEFYLLSRGQSITPNTEGHTDLAADKIILGKATISYDRYTGTIFNKTTTDVYKKVNAVNNNTSTWIWSFDGKDEYLNNFGAQGLANDTVVNELEKNLRPGERVMWYLFKYDGSYHLGGYINDQRAAITVKYEEEGTGKTLKESTIDYSAFYGEDYDSYSEYFIEAPEIDGYELIDGYDEKDGKIGCVGTNATDDTVVTFIYRPVYKEIEAEAYLLNRGINKPDNGENMGTENYSYVDNVKLTVSQIQIESLNQGNFIVGEDLAALNIQYPAVQNLRPGEEVEWYVLKLAGNYHLDGCIVNPQARITVNCEDENGIFQTVDYYTDYGKEYEITAPEREYYDVVGDNVISGDSATDKTVTFTYAAKMVDVTVEFRLTRGSSKITSSVVKSIPQKVYDELIGSKTNGEKNFDQEELEEALDFEYPTPVLRDGETFNKWGKAKLQEDGSFVVSSIISAPKALITIKYVDADQDCDIEEKEEKRLVGWTIQETDVEADDAYLPEGHHWVENVQTIDGATDETVITFEYALDDADDNNTGDDDNTGDEGNTDDGDNDGNDGDDNNTTTGGTTGTTPGGTTGTTTDTTNEGTTAAAPVVEEAPVAEVAAPAAAPAVVAPAAPVEEDAEPVDEDEEIVTIEDETTALAAAPEDDSADDAVVTIDEEETPLAAGPQELTCSILPLLIMCIVLAIELYITHNRKKRQANEFDGQMA